jgi:hypothetical protein
MTKAEIVMEKLALSSELYERAFLKAQRIGNKRQMRLFRKAQDKALDREIKTLLGPDFVKRQGENKVRQKKLYGTDGVSEWNSVGGTFINRK